MAIKTNSDTLTNNTDLLAKNLRPFFESHIREMEKIRRLPKAVVDELKARGIFRMLAPNRFGGQELDFPLALERIKHISAIDASIGWVSAINSGACLMLAKLPIGSLEVIYKGGPDQIIAGSAQAHGIGTRVPGGWQVTGRWPLASGCNAADWIIAAFKADLAGGPEERTIVRAMLLPANRFVIEDTWHAMGLRGTGSHHISIDKAFVPGDYVISLGLGTLSIDKPLYRHPPHLIALTHGAVQLGIARAAMEDLLGLQRVRPIDDPSGHHELVHFELGKCVAKLKAAEAVFERQVDVNWSDTCAGLPPEPTKLTATIQTGVHVAQETLDIVRRCFQLAGSAAIYEGLSLERRLRDIHVATQHGLIKRANFTAGGKALLDSSRDQFGESPVRTDAGPANIAMSRFGA
ncbi:acyl-CoA dehydrogenase family protein [Phyllobacterium sp. SB3]|uniref:acyl-CoA dehydrogenase family protein n=1 Tax=Phyllobacterium sp. SB3 TaxID=3156073 RepID=UPI0032AF374B